MELARQGFRSDELGNVIAVSDSSGNIVKQTCYGPYGDVWSQTGSFDTPWGFGGAYGVYTDPDVELLRMQARYYSPEMKRFISADPTGIKGGVNFYTYADGNPLNSIDPEGLCARPSLFGRTSLFGSSSSFSGIRSASFGGFSPSGSFPGISSFSHENLGFGERAYRSAATFTGARGFTTAIQGRDPFGDSFSRSLSTGQRWAAAGSGALNFGMYMAGSAALGSSAGAAFNRGSYALSAARSAAPYASPAFRSMSAPAASRAPSTALSRGEYLRQKYAQYTPVQRQARIAELQMGNRVLREAGVPHEYISRALQSFEPGTITTRLAGQNDFGLRFYGGKAGSQSPFLAPTFEDGNIRARSAVPEVNTLHCSPISSLKNSAG